MSWTLTYSSDIHLYVMFGFLLLVFSWYFLFERQRREEMEKSTFVLTGKELNQMVSWGMIIGLFVMTGMLFDSVARSFDNVLYFLVPMTVLLLVFMAVERRGVTPFLNSRKISTPNNIPPRDGA